MGNQADNQVDEDDILSPAMEIAWQFSYAAEDERLNALYRKAKRLQWDAERDIDWSQPIDPSRPLIDEERFGFTQLPFVQALPAARQEALRAHVAAFQLSQFMHGEQGALMTAAALTHAVPDYEGKLYAATQTMDEARHVEVYQRYIDRIALVYPMAKSLRALIDKTLCAGSWIKIAIGMNMVVEGLALAAFQNMKKATSCGLLRQILEGVLRDEARHVAFGGSYVTQAVAALHPDEREDIAEFAFEVVATLRGARPQQGDGGFAFDPGFVKVLEVVGIDPADLLRGILEARARGIKIQPPSDQVHAFRDLMIPALVRAGAITERTRPRYRELGLPVHDDLSALKALEGA